MVDMEKYFKEHVTGINVENSDCVCSDDSDHCKRFYDEHISFRVNRDMLRIIDYWINSGHLVCDDGHKLFSSRSQFIKSCIMFRFDCLDKEFPPSRSESS